MFRPRNLNSNVLTVYRANIVLVVQESESESGQRQQPAIAQAVQESEKRQEAAIDQAVRNALQPLESQLQMLKAALKLQQETARLEQERLDEQHTKDKEWRGQRRCENSQLD